MSSLNERKGGNPDPDPFASSDPDPFASSDLLSLTHHVRMLIAGNGSADPNPPVGWVGFGSRSFNLLSH